MAGSKRRLLVIFNRLPITLKQLDNGDFDFQPSAGGSVTALNMLSDKIDFEWFGWPGLEVPREQIPMLQKRLASEFRAVPIWLSKSLGEHYYNGFSNQILWPILHGFRDKMIPDETAKVAYEAVNRIFAKEVASHVRDNDNVWIQDYHLMLLPQYLREELGNTKKNVKLGFFLHTPFPEGKDWSIMPLQDQILRGVLGSNLVGFHTPTDAINFRQCCRDTLDADITDGAVHIGSRLVDVAEFPIGIQPEDFDKLLDDSGVQATISSLRQQFGDMKVIVGLERMDYIKGIPERLRAFDKFLTDFPQRKEKTKLIQVAVPSRGSCLDYQKLISEVNSLVSEINGKHSTIAWTPIRYIHHPISKKDLAALYAISDICLVTSLRDGMNLVSYEYVACQQDRGGVLILSKHTGAAESLHGALLVDPTDVDQVARAIEQALLMPEDERKRWQLASLRKVRSQTSVAWAESFTKRLRETE